MSLRSNPPGVHLEHRLCPVELGIPPATLHSWRLGRRGGKQAPPKPNVAAFASDENWNVRTSPLTSATASGARSHSTMATSVAARSVVGL
jgi:hypothetical protein